MKSSLTKWNLLHETDGEKEGTDSTKCTEADGPPTKRSKSCKKDSTMQFLLGTL